ncbi:hypothetical protein [Halobacillus sp. A5]|uniref:hypothetical protein n=1 Tax=Halobacillus sp. A5 TaxID=2880263 RepID=UPI0020A6BEE7|nr:hypothetical protein [Halobacillus sp. A5]MCP3029259.1 hypothetical protein [Halobacillus sp. A5]
MTYYTSSIKLLFHPRNQLVSLRKAERLRGFWKTFFLLFFFTILTYAATAWAGLGTDPLSGEISTLSRIDFEFQKVWFLFGRIAAGLSLFLGVLILPPFIFWLLFDLPFKKIVNIQLSVWILMLVERLTWIPFMIYLGLDWYVSPLSFGIIASYFTHLDWMIYFFGSLSLFQLFIVWFQVKSITWLSPSRRWWIIAGVILWNIILWAGTAALVYFDETIVQLLLS